MASLPNPAAGLSARQRGALALVVGTLLVVNPLYVTGFHVASSHYTYRTAPVTVADGDIEVATGEGERVYPRIEGIDCTGSPIRTTRACALDRQILRTGAVTAADEHEGGERTVRLDGRYYRRVVSDDNGTIRLGLEQISAREALDQAAVPESTLTWPGRVLVFTGQVTTTYPLEHAGHVVWTEDGYRLLYLTSFERGGGSIWAVSLLGVVAGLWLLVRGYRQLPAERN